MPLTGAKLHDNIYPSTNESAKKEKSIAKINAMTTINNRIIKPIIKKIRFLVIYLYKKGGRRMKIVYPVNRCFFDIYII